jgi:hypothetical protein
MLMERISHPFSVPENSNMHILTSIQTDLNTELYPRFTAENLTLHFSQEYLTVSYVLAPSPMNANIFMQYLKQISDWPVLNMSQTVHPGPSRGHF